MRKLLFAILLILAATSQTQAADDRPGNWNLFDGISYTSADILPGRYSYWGVGVNAARFISSSNFSIVGDFSIHFKSESTLLYALGGARYQFDNRTANVFLEGLAGVTSLNPKVGDTNTAPAFGLGGGIDWKPWDRVYLRIPQVDLFWGSYKGDNFFDYRIQGGVTVPF